MNPSENAPEVGGVLNTLTIPNANTEGTCQACHMCPSEDGTRCSQAARLWGAPKHSLPVRTETGEAGSTSDCTNPEPDKRISSSRLHVLDTCGHSHGERMQVVGPGSPGCRKSNHEREEARRNLGRRQELGTPHM